MGVGRRPGGRGEAGLLAEAIQVTDDSPLKSPKVRNQFEHIDQKIDKWFGRSKRHNYIGRAIGPYGNIRIEGEEGDGDRFGHWDPEAGIVTFWTHSVSIPSIVGEASRIHPIVRRAVYRE